MIKQGTTLKKEGYSEITEKKSVFKGYAVRITSEEEAKEIIDKVRKQEKGARHNVYAYMTGDLKRYSDDGEPQGTGGLPVLSVLEKQGVSDALIIVTRYFGGILLGASGLSRAYGNSAGEALLNAEKVTVVQGTEIILTLPYDVHSRIENILAEEKIQIIGTEFTHEVKVRILILNGDEESFIKRYTEYTNGRAIITLGNINSYFLDEKGILTPIPKQ